MTITLPSDAETERLARKLADATGKPLPLVVKEAIEAEAARVGVVLNVLPPPSDRLARMMEIAKGFDSLPVLDARSADEIIGYDEYGVPK